jgi:hypothetical protein
MADDDKNKPAPPGPKGRGTAANSEKILAKQKEVAEKQVKRQDQQLKLQEAQKKIDEAMNRGQTTLANSLSRSLDGVKFAIEKDPNNADLIATRLEETEDIIKNVDNALEAQGKKIDNDPVVRGLADLVEENKRNTTLLEADSTAQLELQNQLRSLNGSFSGLDEAGRANAELLQQEFEISSQALKDAIESGDMQAQDLAMKQLEEIKAGAESEENRREAQKMNELANSRLYQIADATEKTAEGIGDAISGALASAGVLAGLAGFALLFLDPEAFQSIMESIIDNVGGVIDFIEGIITGDFEQAMGGLGDSWMLLSGVALALLPRVVGFIANILKAVKVFQVFMMKTFIPGIINMYRSIMSSRPVIVLTQTLNKIATGFKLFMMGTFIPGMVSMFTGMIAAVTPILVAMAPILLPILAIAAVFGLIAVALAKIRDAMGFTSIFDVLMLGLAHMKDAFAHVVNTVGSIVNFIMGLVEKFGKFLGFEIELPKIPEMATDNAAKKKAELEVKAAEAAIEEAKKNPTFDELEQGTYEGAAEFDQMLESSPEFDAAMIDDTSFNNALEKGNFGSGDAIVTTVTRQGDTNSSSTNITTIQAPLTQASSILGSVTSR